VGGFGNDVLAGDTESYRAEGYETGDIRCGQEDARGQWRLQMKFRHREGYLQSNGVVLDKGDI